MAFNGGMVPVLETPEGELIGESAVIMNYAQEAYPDSGLQLIPKDAFAAARMRLKMVYFDKLMSKFFPILMTRGKDESKIVEFA